MIRHQFLSLPHPSMLLLSHAGYAPATLDDLKTPEAAHLSKPQGLSPSPFFETNPLLPFDTQFTC